MMTATDDENDVHEMKNISNNKVDLEKVDYEVEEDLWKSMSMKRLVPPVPPDSSLWTVFSNKIRQFQIILGTAGRDGRGLTRFLKLKYCIGRAKSRNSTIPSLFMENVRKHPNKIAFYFEEEKWTFAEIDEYSNRVANYFKETGIKHGDCVALFMENRVEYICTWLGLTKLGAVPALINYNLRLAALSHSIRTVSCKAIICGAEIQEAIKDVVEEFTELPLYVSGTRTNPIALLGAKNLDEGLRTSQTTCPPEIEKVNFADNMVYIYTSGTTGLPKAAVIKHSRCIYLTFGVFKMINLSSNEVLYDPLPLYHTAGGLLGVGIVLLYGGSAAIRRKFSASSFWSDCVKYNCTAAQYIGEICRYLLNTPSKPEDTQHKIRLMFGNGLRPDIWTQFTERFNIPLITEFYGATEGNASLINFEGKPGAIGFLSRIAPWAYPCMLIRIDKETGEPIRDSKGQCIKCEPGEPGELVGKVVRNDPIRDFHGYSDKSATSKKIAPNVFKMGDVAFRSGDILVMDDEGYLYFKDRTGDTFRWKGENVSTTEVENVISKCVNNAAVVVYGVEIPGTDGRAGMAAIHDPDTKVNLMDLFDLISKNLPAYARPVFLRRVSKLDMTGTYKLKKTELQKEAYDINKVQEEIYILDPKSGFKLLTQEFYENILAGKSRF